VQCFWRVQFRGIICAHIFIVIQFVRSVEIQLHMRKRYYNIRAGVIVCVTYKARVEYGYYYYIQEKKNVNVSAACRMIWFFFNDLPKPDFCRRRRFDRTAFIRLHTHDDDLRALNESDINIKFINVYIGGKRGDT